MKQKSAEQHTEAGDAAATPATPAASAPAEKMSLGKALGMLALLGLASPFLDLADPMHGIIGLIILLVGLRIAWQLTATKPLDISGPIDQPAPAVSR